MMGVCKDRFAEWKVAGMWLRNTLAGISLTFAGFAAIIVVG
jgi:hypothetical protein